MGSALNGVDWKITPFPPGCWESYSVLKDGLVEMKTQKRFYEIGVSKPAFKVPVPWEGNFS